MFTVENGDGGNRTHDKFPPNDGLRNCVLMHPTDQLTRRVRLPVIRLPHEWHEDKLRRPACVKPSPVKGRTFPATPVYGKDANAILDALYTPEIHGVGKWSSRWGAHRHRNRTIMAVAKGTGMRIHEILLLRLSDIDPETFQVVVRRGKGGKRRLIAILPDALAEVETWLPTWTARGFTREADDFLFPVLEGESKGGMLEQGYVRKHLHKAAREAGVTVRAACHQWRHGLAVELHRRGVPIGVIQRQLGHASPGTTGIYLAGISAHEVIETVVAAMAKPSAVTPPAVETDWDLRQEGTARRDLTAGAGQVGGTWS